jgi:hypothetical protein
MSVQMQSNNPVNPVEKRHGGVVGGAILISIGLFALLEQFVHVEWGLYFLPFLALIFLTAGILGRRPGLLIPGGILAGIGAGSLLVEAPFMTLAEPARGGLFLLAFAGGWAIITAASYLIGRLMLWPLIPAGFMALIGAALLAGQAGLQLLVALGYVWPVILIALGAYLIFRRRSN